jgi:hypothetical protein
MLRHFAALLLAQALRFRPPISGFNFPWPVKSLHYFTGQHFSFLPRRLAWRVGVFAETARVEAMRRRKPNEGGSAFALAHRQFFALPAGRAEKKRHQRARIRIKFANHPQLETAAFEAGHCEPPKRAVRRRLGRLIILTPHEISHCIHASRLSPTLDKCCPTKNFPVWGAQAPRQSFSAPRRKSQALPFQTNQTSQPCHFRRRS